VKRRAYSGSWKRSSTDLKSNSESKAPPYPG
jgi:hypothetical protein